MTGLATTTLNGISLWAGWISIIAGFVTAMAALMTFLANAEITKRSDARTSQNERATAEANVRAATADREAARANERTSELKLQATALEERAARAELETAKLNRRMAWRTIPDDQARDYEARLSDFVGQKYELLISDDRETRSFGLAIDTILQRAGWVRSAPREGFPVASEVPAALVAEVGLQIVRSPRAPTRASGALAKQLKLSGFPVTERTHEALMQNPDVLGVIVGFKPAA